MSAGHESHSLVVYARARVVPVASANAFRSASTIVSDAHLRAVEIVDRAKQEACEEKRKGFEAGLAQGERDMAAMMTEALVRRDNYWMSSEPQLISVVMNGVRRIVEGFDDLALTRAVVLSALLGIRRKAEATVRVAPSQINGLNESLDMLRRRCPNLTLLRIIGDSALPPGRCVVVSDLGSVTTDIQTQLAAIEAAILSAGDVSQGVGGQDHEN